MTGLDILVRAEQRARQAHQAQVSDWYNIAATAKSGGKSVSKVYIYDAIGGWFGIAAADFVQEVNALDAEEIELHLNSPGGSAFDSIAIHNALRQHAATVRVVVDGMAASGASLIAMAGDHVTMAAGSMMMIHNASGGCLGNADDMRQIAEVLDKIDASQAVLYAAKAGGTRDDWRTAMRAETWYSAEEAVAAGLADAVDPQAADENATASFDLSIFAYAGRDQAPAPKLPGFARAHQTPAEPDSPREENQVDREAFLSALRERFGITDAAIDEAGILAAVDEVLAEQQPTSTGADLPEGTVAISQTVLTALQADATEGRAAREQQLTDQREALITAALGDGRIAAADADDWRTSLTREPSTASLLARLAKGTVPVAEVGHAGDPDDVADVRDTSAYKNWSI